jgi:signal transduction histidine kinase
VPAQLSHVDAAARAALADLREVLDVLHPQSFAPVVHTVIASTRGNSSTSRRRLDLVDVLLVLALVPLAVETSVSGRRGPIWLNLLAAALQAVALVGARRHVVPGTAALLCVAGLQTAFLTPLPPTISWLLPSVLVTFLVARQLPARSAVVAFLFVALGFAAVTLVTPAAHRALDGVLPDAAIAALTFWAGRTLRAREGRVAELAILTEELARRNEEEARLAALERRADMARELHDLGAHVLTIVCLQSGAAQAMWEVDRTRALGALDVLNDLARDTLTHLKESLTGLSSLPDDATAGSMDPASLEVLAGLGRVLGLDVTVTVRGTPQALPSDVARAAFRVVQEALTNAARHAAPTRVEIDLSYAEQSLEVMVSDSGPEGPGRPGRPGRPERPERPTGTAPITITGSGSGLRGMRERVHACRGELASGPREGGGFTVRARLPLGAAA